ncbi:LysR family transcriptional regulator, partial [Azospirillum brasilense]|nr:LysR family transcriptional regulator [Azospirillum brasilense]
MDLAGLAVLVEAAQAGSLAGAARRLGISPLMGTRRLAAREEARGARLIDRPTRPPALSPGEGPLVPLPPPTLETVRGRRATS